jgi:hydrogenase/urease accessory protein HupE
MQDYKKENLVKPGLKSWLNDSAVLTKKNKTISRITRLIILFLVFLGGFSNEIFAHPSPNSAVLLTVHSDGIDVELQLPISELQLIFGQDFIGKPKEIIPKYNEQLRTYILKHFRPTSLDNRAWNVILKDFSIEPSQQLDDKFYQDLSVHLQIIPPTGASTRAFNLNYDVIIHQVATHSIIVSIRQDWESGISAEEPSQIGVMSWDVVNNELHPFKVNLQQGSIWQGFKNMVTLGISHIWEGTDHILFILTLLLPSMLLAQKKRWAEFMGAKNSLTNLLKIITAFTIGHSLTLLLGSVHWINLPTKPIEIFIAITILISALHAYRPIYPKKEVLIAGVFGLIHGLAFAETLTNLQLSTQQMFLSILGFNIGIEMMQIFIILLVFPILILLNKTRYYTQIRQIGAIIMMILAFAWMVERIQEKPNFITEWIA